MATTDILSVIEVGTSQTVYLVGRPDKDGHISIVWADTNTMTGLRKGVIINNPNVLTGLRTVFSRAEHRSALTPDNWLVFSGGNVAADSVYNSILTGNEPVTTADIDETISAASHNKIRDRTTLHVVPQDYVVNKVTRVEHPEGMRTGELGANVLLVHVDTEPLHAMTETVRDAHFDVRGQIFSAICAGRAVLSDAQRMDGALLINLGAGTTSYALYGGGIVRQAGSLPIGGDHVTNDLAHAFRLTFRGAETIKCEHASAVVGAVGPDATVPLPNGEINARGRRINLADANTVVNARVDELFRLVLDRLNTASIPSVVLVGGGALLKGVDTAAAAVFGCPCSVGAIQDGTHHPTIPGPVLATVYGALYIAYDERCEEYRHNKKSRGSIFGSLFGGKGDLS